jgi:predicted glycogen debranching enzyme
MSVRAFSGEALLGATPWDEDESPDWALLVEREWLVTNGLGGYASGTVCGAATRRYHGLLIAAHPPPLGRVLTLADVMEAIHLGGGRCVRLGGEERPDALSLHGARYLTEFRLDVGLPVWTYRVGGRVLEKRLMLPHGRNVVVVAYRLLEGEPVELELRPMVRLRHHDTPVDRPLERGYQAESDGEGFRVSGVSGFPELRLRFYEGGTLYPDPRVVPEFIYRIEASRGYGSVGDTWSPGAWRARLEPGFHCLLVASTEKDTELPTIGEARILFEEEGRRRRSLIAAAHSAAQVGVGPELVLAADQFVIRPLRHAAADAAGDEERSVIAGYHWFTDWGRDTMISLEGLTLTTGRAQEARAILRMFGGHVRHGLIPNLFPEGGREGLYHTADATLWFFHALDRYVQATEDLETLRHLLPTMREIVDAHIHGTDFGIAVDPQDGLLRQGAEGYQLTWMDAKVDDYVVTPRRGKAVEINALWYNALRVMADWERSEGEPEHADELDARADRVRQSFNQRFWIPEDAYLYDVVDGEEGDDSAFRPNQVFAVSLPHPVLDESRWDPVVLAVRDRLLTPVGLRSLSPGHPDYRDTYFGDLWARDAAYHHGTVWSWLIGPFVDAWLRIRPDDRETARGYLDGLIAHMDQFGLGSIAEVFDGDPPHRPRGCIAQAWGVAELLRCLVQTGGEEGEVSS